MRLRAEYRVGYDLKFLGNLDMMNLMNRAVRRSGVPFALSEGFNPHIKLSMGTVLPVGVWGENEYFDIELTRNIDLQDFKKRLNEVLPEGMVLKQCQEIDRDAPALMKMVNAAEYAFRLKKTGKDLSVLLEEMLHRDSLVVKSRGKKKNVDKDLRPGIFKIAVNTKADSDIINIWVNVGEPVNVRYDEIQDLLLANGIERESILDIFRSGNYLYSEGRFFTPLEKVR